MLFYLFIYGMWYIVGFRKIISFKIGIKKYTKLNIWKNKVDYPDFEKLFEKKLIDIVLIVFLKWFIPIIVLFKSRHKLRNVAAFFRTHPIYRHL
jgi:uncharacterized membrane protein YesL